MSTEALRRIETLHQLYQDHTGRRVPLEAWRQNEWARWLQAIEPMGVPAEKAVVMVADRIKWLIRKGEIWGSALSFSRFVMRPDEFQEHLAAALAEGRKPEVNRGYWEVMKATGRSPEPPEKRARRLDEVVASPEFKALVELRKSLEK